jgi:tetratricopeptide (TPR) repeat protein
VEAIWTFLSDPNNQQTLAWLGSGLVAVAGGLWVVIKFLFPRSSGSTPPSQTISADRGGIAAGGNVAIDRRKGMSGIEVALLVAVALGGVLLAVVWLVPQDTPAIREHAEAIRQDTGTLLAGQDELLAMNRRQIELLQQEKGIPHKALVAQLVRLGADPAIDQFDVPTFLERFAEEFVTLREQWQAQTGTEVDATREAALALLDERDLYGARDLLREARQQLRAVRQERALTEATLLADEARVERLDLRYRDAATLLAEAADLASFDPETSWRHRLAQANALYDQGEKFGDNAALAEAIATYEIALDLAPRETRPADWAMTQHNLGNALRALGARESGTATLERAVAAYEAALEERTRERVALDWARTQNGLGNALRYLGPRESGTATLKRAVSVYKEVLEEWTRDLVPLDWAGAKNNLGVALAAIGERETGTASLQGAVAEYNAALEERTRELVPLDWAQTQNNLCLALRTIGEREGDTATLKRAVKACKAALLERTRDRVPLAWATTQSNLGNALRALGAQEKGTATLERAVAAFDAALLERARERVPLDWAYTRHGLAHSLEILADRKNDPARLQEAIDAMTEAAEVYAEGGIAYWLPVAEESLERMRARLVEMKS